MYRFQFREGFSISALQQHRRAGVIGKEAETCASIAWHQGINRVPLGFFAGCPRKASGIAQELVNAGLAVISC
jgi:hypothetical protein